MNNKDMQTDSFYFIFITILLYMEFERGNIIINYPLIPKIVFFLFTLKNFKKVEERK